MHKENTGFEVDDRLIKINWNYVEALNTVEEQEGLALANKLAQLTCCLWGIYKENVSWKWTKGGK